MARRFVGFRLGAKGSHSGAVLNYVIPTKVGASAGGTPIQRGWVRPLRQAQGDASERSEIAGDAGAELWQASIPLAPLRKRRGKIPRSARNDMGSVI